MADIFPVGSGVTRLRGLMKIMRDHQGSVSLSHLAEETGKLVDELLPLVGVSELLGFARIENGVLVLTDLGRQFPPGNPLPVIRSRLALVEPFKSAVFILNGRSMSTDELAAELKAKGVEFQESGTEHRLLKEVLVKWGVRTKLIAYDLEADRWSLPSQ
ncbi:MAG: AAA-associated domain-containing protein [Candidatus Micrarchaeota archaeon]|nr:AAA-associated domain-containing protein [Candidatus Micrarchaeota archaeon]